MTDRPTVQSYLIRRNPLEDELPGGPHYRRHSSIQRHIDKAPVIDRTKAKKRNNARYPKQYQNKDKDVHGRPLFHVGTDMTLYEFPSHSFPYQKQNCRGTILKPDGTKDDAIKGYTRTITDKDKVIQGVVYHPYGKKRDLARAQEFFLTYR
jgi:hypothetical protein